MRKLKLEELNRVSVPEFKKQDKIPLIVVMENIRSLNNVGTIFRTCDAFNVEAVYLVGITAKPPHREIQKTALGATESVDWEYFETSQQAIATLKSNGFSIFSIEQVEGSTPIDEVSKIACNKMALFLGNEITGVDQLTIDSSDSCLEIPQYGTKHSLNVSVCAGIVIWECYNKLKKV
ncbi:MAG: RNA methyltransferase [Flavobacteriales bacterium]|jgi:tRNA G18 (ribose-2'-O)-methylase SpoU